MKKLLICLLLPLAGLADTITGDIRDITGSNSLSTAVRFTPLSFPAIGGTSPTNYVVAGPARTIVPKAGIFTNELAGGAYKVSIGDLSFYISVPGTGGVHRLPDLATNGLTSWGYTNPFTWWGDGRYVAVSNGAATNLSLRGTPTLNGTNLTDLLTNGNSLTVTGAVTAGSFVGDGQDLANLSVSTTPRLSLSRNSGYVSSSNQIVEITSTAAGFHGSKFVRSSGTNYIFLSTREGSTGGESNTLYRLNADDLTSYQSVSIGSGYGEELLSIGGSIYVGCFGTGADFRLVKVDPDTLATNAVITSGFTVYGVGTMETDGTNVFVANHGVGALSRIAKYSTNGTLIVTNTAYVAGKVTGTGVHSLCWDGQHLYAAGPHSTSGTFITKFDADLNIVAAETLTNSSAQYKPTDDMTHCGDSLYLGLEGRSETDAATSLLRVRKDLLDYEFINVSNLLSHSSSGIPCYGVFTDGVKVYAAYPTTNGAVAIYDPLTRIVSVSTGDLVGGMTNLNEIVFDPYGRMFVTEWQSNPIKRVGRFSLPLRSSDWMVCGTNDTWLFKPGVLDGRQIASQTVNSNAIDEATWTLATNAPSAWPLMADADGGGKNITNVYNLLVANYVKIGDASYSSINAPHIASSGTNILSLSIISAPYAREIEAGSWNTGGLNATGQNLTLRATPGKGSGASGSVMIQGWAATGSATVVQSVKTNIVQFHPRGYMTLFPATTVMPVISDGIAIVNSNNLMLYAVGPTFTNALW